MNEAETRAELVGIFYFQEVLTSTQLFGLVLACVAMVLLNT
jgi:multidrug transporter EmrE-like cation transporter